MNTNNIIEVIKNYLSGKGYNIETDPYSGYDLLKTGENKICLLIEEGETDFEQSVTGLPVKMKSKLIFTLIKPFNKKTEKYLLVKIEMEDNGVELIKTLCGNNLHTGIDDYRFKILPLSSSHSELQIDSLLCMARVIEMEILTAFN